MGNVVCYLEFVSHDLELSKRFFEAVFGWSISPSGDEYLMWSSGEGNINGGIRLEKLVEGGDTASTVVYIQVEDIDASLKAIDEAGGKLVHPKTMISEEHGYFALFNDPCGVCIGLWSAT